MAASIDSTLDLLDRFKLTKGEFNALISMINYCNFKFTGPISRENTRNLLEKLCGLKEAISET